MIHMMYQYNIYICIFIYIFFLYIHTCVLQLFHIMSMMSTLFIVHIFSQFVQLDYRASMSYD